eukprot:1222980-Rhodomonas_salina.1
MHYRCLWVYDCPGTHIASGPICYAISSTEVRYGAPRVEVAALFQYRYRRRMLAQYWTEHRTIGVGDRLPPLTAPLLQPGSTILYLSTAQGVGA